MESATEKQDSLTIRPEGEIDDWIFEIGCYSGEARDSVGIARTERRKDGTLLIIGCVLKREDVTKLRKFLERAEEEWDPNPKSILEIVESIQGKQG